MSSQQKGYQNGKQLPTDTKTQKMYAYLIKGFKDINTGLVYSANYSSPSINSIFFFSKTQESCASIY